MISDPRLAMEIVLRSSTQDPAEIWERLGVKAEVAASISQITSQMLNVTEQDGLVLLELGALLAEAGMENKE